MGTAYRNEPVHYNSNTRQSSKLVGFHCASFHSSIFGHFIRLFLYHHLETFGALCLWLRIFRRKVSGLELRKTFLRTLKSWSQILKPGSHSLTKSPIYHYIWGAGGRGVLGLIFAGYVPLASQHLYPIIVYSVAN